MPVKKVKTDLIGTVSGKQTIAAGASVTSSNSFSFDTIAALVAGMQVVFGGSPDGNVKLEVLTSPDDSNFDTIAYAVFEIDYATGETKQKSMPINVNAGYGKLKITNLDSADNISVWGFITQTLDLN
jgi:hypothetical protein